MATTDAERSRPDPTPIRSPHEHGSPRLALPLPLTSFVGREREVAALAELLLPAGNDVTAPHPERAGDARPTARRARLVTLTGPGGVGKTRLAVRVAEELAGAFADGVWFVPLAAVRDRAEPAAAAVAATVAQTLGLREARGQPVAATVAAYLRPRTALLILDNFEPVIEAAPLVTALLTACPKVSVLATSRERLRLTGEHEVVVPPLAVPTAAATPVQVGACEAVALFVDRARAARPDFRLTDEDAATVAEICRRLDGLPLAIELAAARSKLLAPSTLLGQLARGLDILTGGPRDAPARLRSLRDAIAWSYDLLTPDEQAFFRRLAVFAGGFTMPAAEAVGRRAADGRRREGDGDPSVGPGGYPPPPSVLDLVASLVDKSLLRPAAPVAGGDAGFPRFAMLETVREYGLERLAASGEEPAIRGAHAAYFAALAAEAAPQLTGPEQADWLDRLEAEHENLRGALAWLLDHGWRATAVRLAGALWRFWLTRGHLSEGRGWLERAELAARADPAADEARVTALYGASWLTVEQGDLARAAALAEEGLAIARRRGDQLAIARALNCLGSVAHERGDLPRAAACYEEALACSRSLGDRDAIAVALGNLGLVVEDLGDVDRALELHAEALVTFRALANQGGVAMALECLATTYQRRGDSDRAAAGFEQALPLFRELGDKHGQARTCHGLALVATRSREFPAARRLWEESLSLWREVDDRRGLARWLEGIADLAAVAGRAVAAVRCRAAAAALREAIGYAVYGADASGHERSMAGLHAALGKAEFAQAWAAAHAAPLDEVIAEARAVAAEAAATPPTVAPAPPPLGLSPRELEVLGLLARRYTDKEIAAALFISPRTVARHVAGILAKLGVDSRREAAAIAARDGLA